VARHKAVTAAIVAFIGTGGALIYYQRSVQMRRRRARRAPNGARKEVVVIAGPPGSPVTKTLMLDLEKRGFIVYVVVHTPEEEDIIKAEGVGRTDIRPFLINIADACGVLFPDNVRLLTIRIADGDTRSYAAVQEAIAKSTSCLHWSITSRAIVYGPHYSA
jgi:hypothetical protein